MWEETKEVGPVLALKVVINAAPREFIGRRSETLRPSAWSTLPRHCWYYYAVCVERVCSVTTVTTGSRAGAKVWGSSNVHLADDWGASWTFGSLARPQQLSYCLVLCVFTYCSSSSCHLDWEKSFESIVNNKTKSTEDEKSLSCLVSSIVSAAQLIVSALNPKEKWIGQRWRGRPSQQHKWRRRISIRVNSNWWTGTY